MNLIRQTDTAKCRNHGTGCVITPGRRAVEKDHLFQFELLPDAPSPFVAAGRFARAIARHGPGPNKIRARMVCRLLLEGLRA